jgi:hypothetical protein
MRRLPNSFCLDGTASLEARYERSGERLPPPPTHPLSRRRARLAPLGSNDQQVMVRIPSGGNPITEGAAFAPAPGRGLKLDFHRCRCRAHQCSPSGMRNQHSVSGGA